MSITKTTSGQSTRRDSSALSSIWASWQKLMTMIWTYRSSKMTICLTRIPTKVTDPPAKNQIPAMSKMTFLVTKLPLPPLRPNKSQRQKLKARRKWLKGKSSWMSTFSVTLLRVLGWCLQDVTGSSETRTWSIKYQQTTWMLITERRRCTRCCPWFLSITASLFETKASRHLKVLPL